MPGITVDNSGGVGGAGVPNDNSVTSAKIANGAILNEDVNAAAALDYSKLATLATGSALLGNAGVPTATALSGDATVGATGVLTIANSAVTDAKVAAANKDGAAGTASMRTLSTTSTTAAAGNDARFPAGADIVAGDIASNAVTTVKILDANVTDAKLASPNNSAYRPIRSAGGQLIDNTVADTYITGTGSPLPTVATAGQAVFYLDPADYAVAGLTARYLLRVSLLTNTVAPTSTFTAGLYPVTASGGAADVNTITLGTVVSGSTVAFAAPSASTRNQGNSGDFTAPAADYYIFGIVVSVATTANDSRTSWVASLAYRNT